MTPHPESRKLVKITFLVIYFFRAIYCNFFSRKIYLKMHLKMDLNFMHFLVSICFFFGLFLTFFLLNNSWILSYFISVLKKVCFVFFRRR